MKKEIDNMCGIFGNISLVKTGANYKTTKTLHDMALMSQVRGTDGTGVFFLDDKSELMYYKEPTCASACMDKTQLDKMVTRSRFTIGHVRAATQGSMTEADTHPFIYEHVVGVHNGTIMLWDDVPVLKDSTAAMDSSAIYDVLNGTGSDEAAVGKVLGGLEIGAYALVWYDKRIKQLRLARNNERPLYIAHTSTDIWIGSELRMLEWALDRNGYLISSAYSVDSHKLLSIPMDGTPATIRDYYEDIDVTSVSLGAYNNSSYKTGFWNSSYPSSGQLGSYDAWDDDDDDVVFNRTGHRPVSWHDRQEVLPQTNTLITAITVDAQWPALPDPVKKSTRDKIQNAIIKIVGVLPEGKRYVSLYDQLGDVLADKIEGATVNISGQRQYPIHIVHLDEDGTPYAYIVVDGMKKPVSLASLWTKGGALYNGLIKIDELLLAKKEAIVTCGRLTSIRAYAHGDVAYRGILPYTLDVTDVAEGIDLSSVEGKDLIEAFYFEHPDMVDQTSDEFNWDHGWDSYEITEGVY